MKKNKIFILFIFLIFSFQIVVAEEPVTLWSKHLADDKITGLEISPNGKHIVVNSNYKNVLIFDDKGNKIYSDNINPTKIDINDKYIVASYQHDKTIYDSYRNIGHIVLYSNSGNKKWDKEIVFADKINTRIKYLSISNKYFIAAAINNNINIYDFTGYEQRSIHVGAIDGMKFSQDGDFLYYIYDNHIYFYDLNNYFVEKIPINYDLIDFSASDNGNLVTISNNNEIYYYNNKTLIFYKTIETNSFPNRVYLHKNGDWIFVSTTKGEIFIFDKNGELDHIIENANLLSLSDENNLAIIAKSYSYTASLLDLTPYYTSSLNISSQNGAEIYLNEEFQGISPLLISNVSYGNYSLKISKDGYQTLEQIITVPHSTSLEFDVPLNVIVQ